jgi:tetratricopeptide (TPR) repeat protein
MRIELIDLLIQAGELEKAEAALKTEQTLYPDMETRSLMMGRLARKKGDAGNAVRYYQQALAANPRSSAIHLELGKYLMEIRRWKEAARHWLLALQVSPTNIEFAGQYALLIAACPDPGIRNGNKALALSQQLMPVKKETVDQDIVCALAHASALAETQQYDKALAVAKEYLLLSTTYQKTESAGQWQTLVQLCQSRKPYRL